MKCINMIFLTGHIATDPQSISESPLGVKFRLATNEKHFSKKKGEYVTTSEFHTIKCWKQNAQFTLDRLKKGSCVFIRGKLHHHNYVTTEGRRGTNSEIIATQVIQLDKVPSTEKEIDSILSAKIE